ncbi:unnamed protein product, partial [Pelagomonas calceolata]
PTHVLLEEPLRVSVVAEARPPQRPIVARDGVGVHVRAVPVRPLGFVALPRRVDLLAVSIDDARPPFLRSGPPRRRHAQVRDATVEGVDQTRRLGRVGDVSEKGQLGPRLLYGCAPLLFGHGGHDAQEGAVAVESRTHLCDEVCAGSALLATRWQMLHSKR